MDIKQQEYSDKKAYQQTHLKMSSYNTNITKR